MQTEQATAPAEPTTATPPPEPPTLDEAFDLVAGKLSGWAETAIRNLPNLLVAVLIAVAFWLVAKLVRNGVDKALRRTPLPAALRKLTVGVVGFAILVAGLFIALGVLGLDKTVAALLGGVGIVGLALGFAFQDIAANFMSGILISVRKPFEQGDLVETNDFFGTVEEINLRATVLRRPTGQLVVIPNKSVFENPIVNYTKPGQRRIDLGCGVAYGDDLELAERTAIAAIEAVEGRDENRDVELFFTEFGGSSIDFVVRFWIGSVRQADYLAAKSQAIKRLKKALDDAGLTIPFPIRTLDFGVVGGERLDEVLGRRDGEPNDGEPSDGPSEHRPARPEG